MEGSFHPSQISVWCLCSAVPGNLARRCGSPLLFCRAQTEDRPPTPPRATLPQACPGRGSCPASLPTDNVVLAHRLTGVSKPQCWWEGRQQGWRPGRQPQRQPQRQIILQETAIFRSALSPRLLNTFAFSCTRVFLNGVRGELQQVTSAGKRQQLNICSYRQCKQSSEYQIPSYYGTKQNSPVSEGVKLQAPELNTAKATLRGETLAGGAELLREPSRSSLLRVPSAATVFSIDSTNVKQQPQQLCDQNISRFPTHTQKQALSRSYCAAKLRQGL